MTSESFKDHIAKLPRNEVNAGYIAVIGQLTELEKKYVSLAEANQRLQDKLRFLIGVENVSSKKEAEKSPEEQKESE